MDSPSITQYSDQIARGLHIHYPEIRVTETRPPSLAELPIGRIGRGAATHFLRFGWYPMRAREIQSDLNHITDHVHAYLVRHLPAQRTIVTCHDLTTFVHPENIRNTSLVPMLTEKVFQTSINLLHEAACVIAVSENTKKDVLKYSRCTAEQVHVVHHGVGTIFTDSADGARVLEFRQQYAQNGARLLLHVGLNTPYKNVESVLRVVRILNTEMGQNVMLIKAGQQFTPAQSRMIEELGLSGRVAHLGKLAPHELVTCYQASDVLLFPSIYEGFGWPPLEAMACGTPVVASTAGSIPEIAGDAAILEDPTDVARLAGAVAGVLKNDELRKRLIAAGLKRAKLFTWQRSIAQLVSIYHEVSRLAPLRT